jgi:demethylmenaquinone methyltransferase / 2-methoxy-6-polyprenyl-1,4-benzoquinol methylase
MLARSRSQPNQFARSLFGGLPRRYDLLAEVLSFGQNRRWRQEMVDHVARPAAGPSGRRPRLAGRGGILLDVATGTAGVAVLLAERTGARVVGLDLTPAMLEVGRERARGSLAAVPTSEGQPVGPSDGWSSVSFVLGRGEQLPFPDASFDGLTFTYLLRYVSDPSTTIRELARVVRPGGVVASLEFHPPAVQPWRSLWWLYTRLVLPVAGLLLGGRDWFAVGRFLGPSISEHYRCYPDRWALDAWRRAGLEDVGLREMSVGGGVVMWARRGG